MLVKATNRLKFSYGANVLLVLLVFRCIVDLFEDSYITTQLSIITGGNTTKIAIYYIVKHLLCPIGALLAGRWVKTHCLTVMRIGIIADLIFFIAFSQIKDTWGSIIVIAAIQGLALVLYYLPLSFVTANWVLDKERHRFLSYQSVISKTMSIIIPVTLGTIIYATNYNSTIKLMIVIVALQLITIAVIRRDKTCESSNFDMLGFVKKSVKDKEMRDYFLISILKGLTLIGAQSQLINMLIFNRFGNEYELGKITSLIAILSIISFWTFGKFGSEKIYRQIIKSFTVIQVVVVLALLAITNEITIIAIRMCFDCTLSIVRLIADNYCYKLVNKPLNETMKSEFFVYQEFGLNIGRIISWIIVIFVSLLTFVSSGTILTVSLCMITIAFVIMSVMLSRALKSSTN